MMDNDCMIIETDTQPCNYQCMDSSPPSKIAALLATKVKIKKEFESPPIDAEEMNLLPKSQRDHQVVSQLRQMGFISNNDREIMVALREVEKKLQLPQQMVLDFDTGMTHVSLNNLVEETMLYIVTQREEQNEARKMDIAREQSEEFVAQERQIQKSSLYQMFDSASIDEIVGFENENEDDSKGNDVNSSVYFPSSSLLATSRVKKHFRIILENDCPDKIAWKKITHLLTLEKKAFKWFGNKIPYAYFGITLPDRLLNWCETIQNDESHKAQRERQEIVVNLIQVEIDDIQNAMYSLSEQQEGDLGLMVPKKFLKARETAIAKGLITNYEDNNMVIIDD